jgi:pyridinium-3,5-biscarboxylic acid mononucleotide synthase
MADQEPMDKELLKKLLTAHKTGRVQTEQVIKALSGTISDELKEICFDNLRALRTGFPEVIYGGSKSVTQILSILKKINPTHSRILITAAPAGIDKALKKARIKHHFNPRGRTVLIGRQAELKGRVSVICAGTGDVPVAEEAADTLEAMGVKSERIYDVGVAGLHRILDKLGSFKDSDALVVIAGMEGALPSVVAGLVDIPVIAVPTSVGYGTNFKGLTALLAMLNSCSPGISVVNIDNGFGAGYQAGLISISKNRKGYPARGPSARPVAPTRK